MLRITPSQMSAFGGSYQDALAIRLATSAGQPDAVARMRELINECVENGVVVERDVAELCLALWKMDLERGRPKEVQRLLTDPEVEGRLKVFQVQHAWRVHKGEQP